MVQNYLMKLLKDAKELEDSDDDPYKAAVIWMADKKQLFCPQKCKIIKFCPRRCNICFIITH